MNRIYKTLLQLLVIMGLTTVFTQLAAVAGYLPIDSETIEIYRQGNIPIPPDKSGLAIAKELVLSGLKYVKVIVVVMGILYLSIAGYSLLTSGEEEETATKVKRATTYIIVAFVMISMSQDIAKVFDMQESTLLSSPSGILNRIHIFDKQVELFMTFLKYVIGSYAVLHVVRSSIKWITAGGDEEQIATHKKSILYSASGLVILYIGQIFIDKVIYKVNKEVYTGLTGVHPTVDPLEGMAQLIGITNFIISFTGPIAVLMLMVAAIMYATAGGEEEQMEKAKKLLISTIVGMFIIFGSFAIVSTVVASKLNQVGAIMA